MRKQLAICGLVLAAGAALTPLTSEARVYINAGVAPPPVPTTVVVPGPRAGYVWAPGYWAWNGRRHVWHDGYWVRERRGYHWVAAHWEPIGARWRYVPGYWAR